MKLTSPSNDALTLLRARRSELYERLRLIDRHVAAVQKSPFFGTRAGNAVTMRDSIEGLEGQIADIDRRISRGTRRIADKAAAAVDLG